MAELRAEIRRKELIDQTDGDEELAVDADLEEEEDKVDETDNAGSLVEMIYLEEPRRSGIQSLHAVLAKAGTDLLWADKGGRLGAWRHRSFACPLIAS